MKAVMRKVIVSREMIRPVSIIPMFSSSSLICSIGSLKVRPIRLKTTHVEDRATFLFFRRADIEELELKKVVDGENKV